MNRLKDMILTKIEDDWYAVPVGDAAKAFSGMIRMNKTGKRIFELLAEGKTEAQAAHQLTEEYEVDEETARKNVGDLAQQLRDVGVL